MPRYYFDVCDGVCFPDTVGSEHPDLRSVRQEARRALTEIADGIDVNKDAFQLRLDVRDEAGTRVVTATVMMLLEVVV